MGGSVLLDCLTDLHIQLIKAGVSSGAVTLTGRTFLLENNDMLFCLLVQSDALECVAALGCPKELLLFR